jgi:hypothetical protein
MAEDIQKYQKIFKECFGKEISKAEALKQAMNLFVLMKNATKGVKTNE